MDSEVPRVINTKEGIVKAESTEDWDFVRSKAKRKEIFIVHTES